MVLSCKLKREEIWQENIRLRRTSTAKTAFGVFRWGQYFDDSPRLRFALLH